MVIIGFFLSLCALAVAAFAAINRRRPSLSPGLFLLLVGCVLLAFLGSAHDETLTTALAASAAAVAAAGLCADVLRLDSRLAAEEAGVVQASLGGDTLHSFTRRGQSSLLVFVRRDRSGQVVEASAYDPDDYFHF